MIRVHVWNYRGLTIAMGHASMHIGDVYVSWWPSGEGRRPKLPTSAGRRLPLYSTAHIYGQSFEDDQYLEADAMWDEHRRVWIDPRTSMPASPMPPDHTIPLIGLDEKRILHWWGKFNTKQREWSTLGQNCSTTVAHALTIGGGDDYALGPVGWWRSWNAVWKPNDVLDYARAIRHGLHRKQGRHEAINLIRRFCKSPFGLTSITLELDEAGLANALFNELCTNTVKVRAVFEELNENRRSDADDVAELYVNLLMNRGGSQVEAVARDPVLKSLLIRVLDEGWTSDGEKNCIEFIKSLK